MEKKSHEWKKKTSYNDNVKFLQKKKVLISQDQHNNFVNVT